MRGFAFTVAALLAAPTLAQPASPPAAPETVTAGAGTATAGTATASTARLAPGVTVYDTQGGQVGTIESVTADAVVVSTGTTKATIPPASFGQGSNGPVLALTRAQLEAAVNGTAGPSGR